MEPNEVKIQRLINSMYFGVETVFILIGDNSYRLIGLNGDTPLIDKEYPTLRGAKISFSKFFETRAFREGVKAEWSHTYPVETEWMLPKIALCNPISEKQAHSTQ